MIRRHLFLGNMVKISNVKVYDLRESIIASRNAMRTELPEYTEAEFAKSLERAIKLAKTPSGSGHQTFLSGIRVSFDMVYPNYISPELQRYHWIDIVTSSSKMHKMLQMDFSKCCNKYVLKETIARMQTLIAEYNIIQSMLEIKAKSEGLDEKDEQYLYEKWMVILSNCPQGIELFMRVSTNYLQLKTIWRQRRHHKLKEDWGAVCDFIESLPYAKELICE